MSRTVSKLVDLDIDEVSLVDRSANQHSLVSFSKSLQTGGADDSEESMADEILVFDESGEEVSVEELEHGDNVFDADGNEYVFVAEDADEDELAPVGKSAASNFYRGVKQGVGGFSDGGGRAARAGRAVGRNRKKLAWGAGGTAAAGATAAGAYGLSKSLGDSVIEELSKAVSDADRNDIIAKALDEIEIYKAQAEEATAWAAAEHDARVEEAFISKAAEYNLPVSPEVLGPILKSVAEVLTEEQLDLLDDLFNAVGDALYEEIGFVGESDNNSVLDQVNAMSEQYVGKSDMSREGIMTAMFEANPAAYDAYIAEMGR